MPSIISRMTLPNFLFPVSPTLCYLLLSMYFGALAVIATVPDQKPGVKIIESLLQHSLHA